MRLFNITMIMFHIPHLVPIQYLEINTRSFGTQKNAYYILLETSVLLLTICQESF